jgi:hypothetical protein
MVSIQSLPYHDIHSFLFLTMVSILFSSLPWYPSYSFSYNDIHPIPYHDINPILFLTLILNLSSLFPINPPPPSKTSHEEAVIRQKPLYLLDLILI